MIMNALFIYLIGLGLSGLLHSLLYYNNNYNNMANACIDEMISKNPELKCFDYDTIKNVITFVYALESWVCVIIAFLHFISYVILNEDE